MIQNKCQNQHKNGSLSTKFSHDHFDLNPIENEWAELKRRCANMEDLERFSTENYLKTHQALQEKTLFSWQKEVAKGIE